MMENPVQYCRTKSTLKKCTLRWTVENFSMLSQSSGEALCSTTFILDKNVTFQLLLYPKGLTNDKYLRIHLVPKLEGLQSIRLEHFISILNADENESMYSSNSQGVYSNEGQYLSNPDYLFELSHLYRYLFKDCLRIYCSVTTAVDVSTVEEVVKEVCIDAHASPCTKKLFEEKEFADFTFLLDNQKLKAHKCILAASSTVLKSMLQHGNWKENVEGMMEIIGVLLEVFEEMLHYIYLGAVNNLSEVAPELIYLAEKYDLQGLKALCAKQLSEEIKVENAWRILGIADDCLVKDLKKDAMKFILSNRASMIKRDDYVNIATKQPNLIVEIFSLE